MEKRKGTVYLVGAGPGDPELITLKGKRILSGAETLVYDRLASKELLKLAPESCERIYVGKEPGRHSMKQEEINRLLVTKALEGKYVVRLKGGDPFVFGRGGEEILALEACEIPYEVVPGVTSAIGALSHAGIPVTHRGEAQSFHVITGHTAVGGKDTLTDEFSWYARLSGTLIFLMGLSSLEEIVKRLLENGKAPDTPAAVVTNGTLPEERCVRAALRDLPTAVKNAGLSAPGIIVVGRAAAFCMRYGGERPLSGVSIGITGTDGIFEKLSEKLGAMGAKIIRAGVSRVVPCGMEGLQKAVKNLSDFQWVVFTSRNGIRLFFDAIEACQADVRSLAGLKFAVVGTGTGDYLKTFGIHAEYMPKEYTTRALAGGLCEHVKKEEKIFIPRARQGSKALTDCLDRAGFCFLDHPVYDIVTDEVPAHILSGLDYVTFESGSGVRGFFKTQEKEKRELFQRGVKAVCIGKVTAAALEEFGIAGSLVAKGCTADGILEAILEDRKRGDICL
ncbi:uroporphyrinogen-III C-methyltransferase [Lachnospiraceae bacterium 45-P1]